ncbi:MAG: DUF1178 family protein [Pseudomonadota bacterium]
MKFQLECKNNHAFEGWFRSNDDFEKQQKHGLLECPICGTHEVSKTLMAPSVATGRSKEKIAVAAGQAAQQQMMAKMMELAKEVKSKADNVGEKFPEEARKIHYGESEARAIYGKATTDEVSELVDEGVDILPLPDIPEDDKVN